MTLTSPVCFPESSLLPAHKPPGLSCSDFQLVLHLFHWPRSSSCFVVRHLHCTQLIPVTRAWSPESAKTCRKPQQVLYWRLYSWRQNVVPSQPAQLLAQQSLAVNQTSTFMSFWILPDSDVWHHEWKQRETAPDDVCELLIKTFCRCSCVLYDTCVRKTSKHRNQELA